MGTEFFILGHVMLYGVLMAGALVSGAIMTENGGKDGTYQYDSAQRLMNGTFGVAFLLLIPLELTYWILHLIFV